MSSRVDSAIPTRLSTIRNEHVGKKLRAVGKYVPNQAEMPLLSSHPFYSRVLSHDVRSSTILLWNDCHIVLVDISLCLPTRGSVPWLREPGRTVTIFGCLEQSQVTFYTRQVHPLLKLTEWRHRVPGRPKCACQISCQNSCPVKIWSSFRICPCRRSWCSIPRMSILGFGTRRLRRWRRQVSSGARSALSDGIANPYGCPGPADELFHV